MKTILIILTICFLGNSGWGQTQAERPIVVIEKRQGKVIRVEKYQKVDAVSEGTFIKPRYTHDEFQIFNLPHESTTYDKERMLRLISVFLKQNKKYLDFNKLIKISFNLYFDKNTFELKEITYLVPSGSVFNYSILGKLTEEIKARGGLSLQGDVKTIANRNRLDINKYSANYFIMGMYFSNTDLKPYLNEGSLKN